MKGAPHHPQNATGREKRSRQGSVEPRIRGNTFAGLKGRAGSSGKLPKAKPRAVHPSCTTLKAQWGMIVRWRREGLTPDVVRTTFGDSEDAATQAAVYHYCKED